MSKESKEIITTLAGEWKNQLGSVMKIIKVTDESNGSFEGKYFTSVGNVKKKEFHKIHGTFHYKEWEKEHSLLITISVQWTTLKDTKKPSCTVWSGQCDIKDKKITGIDTMWILRRTTHKKGKWNGVTVNKDYFKRM